MVCRGTRSRRRRGACPWSTYRCWMCVGFLSSSTVVLVCERLPVRNLLYFSSVLIPVISRCNKKRKQCDQPTFEIGIFTTPTHFIARDQQLTQTGQYSFLSSCVREEEEKSSMGIIFDRPYLSRSSFVHIQYSTMRKFSPSSRSRAR